MYLTLLLYFRNAVKVYKTFTSFSHGKRCECFWKTLINKKLINNVSYIKKDSQKAAELLMTRNNIPIMLRFDAYPVFTSPHFFTFLLCLSASAWSYLQSHLCSILNTYPQCQCSSCICKPKRDRALHGELVPLTQALAAG